MVSQRTSVASPKAVPRLHPHLVLFRKIEETTEVASLDARGVRGERLRMRGNVSVGEPGPSPDTRHDDAAPRHHVEVPNLRDTFHEGWGVELLEKGPLPPCPSDPLLCQRRGSEGSLACSSLKNFLLYFFVPRAPRPHHLAPPRLTILCFHPPPPEAQCTCGSLGNVKLGLTWG